MFKLLILIILFNTAHAQPLPASLFPNHELYDLESLLQQNAEIESLLDEGIITNYWTLSEVINMAVYNNLELAQVYQDMISSQATYTGSVQDFYVPNLSVSASATFRDSFTTSSDPVVVSATDAAYHQSITLPSVVLSKTLFNGMYTYYSHRISKENYLNAQNTYSNQIREVAYQAAVRYYDQFLKEEEVKVALERLKQLRDRLAEAERNFQFGRVSDYDVALTRAQYSAAEPDFYSAEKNRLYSRAEFYRYIGYIPEPDVAVRLASSDKNSMVELGNSNQSAQLGPAGHYTVHTSSHSLH